MATCGGNNNGALYLFVRQQRLFNNAHLPLSYAGVAAFARRVLRAAHKRRASAGTTRMLLARRVWRETLLYRVSRGNNKTSRRGVSCRAAAARAFAANNRRHQARGARFSTADNASCSRMYCRGDIYGARA